MRLGFCSLLTFQWTLPLDPNDQVGLGIPDFRKFP